MFIELKIKIDEKSGNFPQFRGAVVAGLQGCPQSMIEAGLEVADLFEQEPPSQTENPKPQKGPRLTPEEIANKMREAGHTPQESGLVMTKILPSD